MSNKRAQEFHSLLLQFFGFLRDEYHFALKKRNDFSYDFETATARISVFIEHELVIVEMVPIGEEDRKLRQKNILPKPLGVSAVANGMDPSFHYEFDWDEPVALSMEKDSQVIKSYCKDFLLGDFTKWTDILEEINKDE